MVPLELATWAIRHNVSPEALADLRLVLRAEIPAPDAKPNDGSETWVQSAVRLEAGRLGISLWRNNSGVLPNPDTGRPVRFGLANDSADLNARIKSPDLVGWRARVITVADVGRIIGQTVLRECKPVGWHYTGTPREEAQARFMQLAISEGCDAGFANGPGTL